MKTDNDALKDARDQLNLILSFFPRVDAKLSTVLAVDTALLATTAAKVPSFSQMNASFDIHAMILSENAPELETALHRHFLTSQVNKLNPRKEFFRVPIARIRQELENLDIKTRWTMTAAAKEHRETLSLERTLQEDPEKGYQLLEKQIRRFVTTNPCACCVVVLNPFTTEWNGSFLPEVRRIVPSTTFHRTFHCESLFAGISHTHVLAPAIPTGNRRMTDPKEVILYDRNGTPHLCSAEGFSTKHQVFVLVRDTGAFTSSGIIVPSSYRSN